jgi:lipid II:glycine glycyltransferase (peptidoglycan interpeptide bridge formation enzyme)
LYESAKKIIREMMERKGYVEFGSMEDMISINQDLPEHLKLKFAFCTYENELAAVLGWFPIGEVGVPLVGATGDKALSLNASYPLWWKMVEYYKSQGATCIDLAGINKERNSGGYLFKTGLAGEKRIEKHYIGQFDACRNVLSSLVFETGMSLRQKYRDMLIKINKLSK